MSDKNEQKKGIKVISGDGSNLDISPVYEHIDAAKPKINEKKPKNIIVPAEKKRSRKRKTRVYLVDPSIFLISSCLFIFCVVVFISS